MNLLTESETSDERSIFVKYYHLGKTAIYDNGLLNEMIMQFARFISCFEYQTEDHEERERGGEWLKLCLYKMVDRLSDLKGCDHWGDFELSIK